MKGAPYYQPMTIQKQGGKPPTLVQRSNSNGRNKQFKRALRPTQPKWVNKEYKPVFKMPESQTI